MILLSFCLPFYTNSLMLAEQLRVWAGYPDALKTRIEIVLVDDGSPAAAVDVPRPDGLPALRIYRVLEDRPWHQHGARNLAAHEAVGTWLFLTDMDHVLPAESLARLLGQIEQTSVDVTARGDQARRLTPRRNAMFTFRRLDAPNLTPKLLKGRPHPHQNTFAVTKSDYWAAGGYAEDLCGFYGTDGYFIRTLIDRSYVVHLEDAPVIRYSRDVIADASTRADRDAARRMGERGAILSRRRPGPQPVLQFPWERVL